MRERDLAQQLHMQYVNVPLPPMSAPPKVDVSRVLALLAGRGDTRVFVHCRRGKDRTGTIVACGDDDTSIVAIYGAPAPAFDAGAKDAADAADTGTNAALYGGPPVEDSGGNAALYGLPPSGDK